MAGVEPDARYFAALASDARCVTLTVYAYRQYTADQWGYANAIGVFIVVSGFLLILTTRRLFRLGEREL